MPWDPVRDLLTMQERLESLFGQAAPGWVPPVDLTELDDRYILTMELPGFSRADVQIEYHDHVLTVRGERRCWHFNGVCDATNESAGLFRLDKWTYR